MTVRIEAGDGASEVFGLALGPLVEAVIDAFLKKYPYSESTSMSRKELREWTEEELDELIRVMNGAAVSPRESWVYSGDVVRGASPLFASLENFIEGKVIVASALSDCIWRAHAGRPRYAQELIRALEDATLKIIRVNMHHFADSCLVPGCLSRDWHGGGVQTSASDSLPGGLTARETEVALLASEGLSNGEIAERIGIARNTVKNHLARIFAKTGTSNRTELARWAIEHSSRVG